MSKPKYTFDKDYKITYEPLICDCSISSPPPPPLNRRIRDDEWLWGQGWCKLCGSTLIRKYLLWGKVVCIHPLCKSNNPICVKTNVVLTGQQKPEKTEI
jgi:hypothetical protein